MWVASVMLMAAVAADERCTFPNLSAGSVNLTQNNYMQFKKDNRLFVLGISDMNCEDCCVAEDLLHSVHSDFKAKRFSFQTKKKKSLEIPVARVDVSKKYSFISQENLHRSIVPAIYVYYEGVYYNFDSKDPTPETLLHFINRLLHPLVPLRTQEQIELFLDQNTEHPEKTRFFMPTGIELEDRLLLGETYQNFTFKTRVIIFIFNKGDYDEELEGVKLAARKSANMLNLRIALVTDHRLVKRLKKETSWFGDASLNTMILKRYDGELVNLDLLHINLGENAQTWIWKKSIKEVEELTPQMFDQINAIGQGVFMCFIDFTSKEGTVAADSKHMVNKVLPDVAKAIYRAMIVVYIDVNKMGDSRRQFGIKHDILPAISVTDQSKQGVAYPTDQPMEVEEIVAFVTRIVKGEIRAEQSTIGEIINEELVKKVEKHIGDLVHADDFESIIRQEGIDSALLLFSSSSTEPFQEEFVT